MPIFTALSTFKPITLTAPQICEGCRKTLPVGEEVLAKFIRPENAKWNVETFCLCKDSDECWQEWDWNYWNPSSK